MNVGRQERPEVTILGCMHACGGWDLPEIVPLPCGGSVDVATLLWPLVQGRQGVVVATCALGQCRHRQPNEGHCRGVAAPVLTAARDVLVRLGLSPRRIAVHPVDATTEPARWVREHVEALSGLPRVPQVEPLLSMERMPAFSVDRMAYLYARLQAAVAAADLGDGAPVTPAGDLFWPGCRPLMQSCGLGTASLGGRLLWERAGEPLTAVVEGRCCGYPLEQGGDSDAFATVARGNAAFLARHQAQRLVTLCPHCQHTLTREYRKVGVELGLPVVDLLTWAAERFADLPATSLSVAALPAVAGDVARETAPLARWARQVTSLQVPSGGSTLAGPALRRWLEDCLAQAAQQGAAALVASCPHEASRYRAVFNAEGWRTGPALPLLDLAEALAFLFGPVPSPSPRREAFQESSHG